MKAPCSWCPEPGSEYEAILKKEGRSCYACGGTRVQKTYDHRNYDAFAILAGVRNGRGFAGIVTGESFQPIAEPRGLPKDLSSRLSAVFRDGDGNDSDWENKYEENKEQLGCGWGGDHSHSWLTLRELIADDAYWSREHVSRGVVGFSEILDMVRENRSMPHAWSGAVSGGAVRHYEAAFLFKVAQLLLARAHVESQAELLEGQGYGVVVSAVLDER